MSIYNETQKSQYVPPPCPRCGQTDTLDVKWGEIKGAEGLYAVERIECSVCTGIPHR